MENKIKNILFSITDNSVGYKKNNKKFYISLYDKIIQRARNNCRIKNDITYYEDHHILPDFLFKNRMRKGPRGLLDGDVNSKNNRVLLTAREHFICHIVLMKIFEGTHFYYSAASAIQFFFNSHNSSHKRISKANFYIFGKKYEFYKIKAIEAISESKKGKIVAKDKKTNKIIGLISLDHPNIISGKWVHHSTGRKWSESERISRGPSNDSKNSNYKDVRLLEPIILEYIKNNEKDIIIKNHIILKWFFDGYNSSRTNKKEKISRVFLCSKYKTVENFIDVLNDKLGKSYQYNPYFRGYKK